MIKIIWKPNPWRFLFVGVCIVATSYRNWDCGLVIYSMDVALSTVSSWLLFEVVSFKLKGQN
jgi:hypothetical protein